VPAGLTRTGMDVQSGPAMRLRAERATVQSLLDQAGLKDVVLPAAESFEVSMDLPTGVVMDYRDTSQTSRPVGLKVFQMPQPTVVMPAGVEPALLGEALLQLLGVPGEEAARLAHTIDWTSTLVIPVPGLVAYREVTVDGVPGVLVSGDFEAEPQERAVLWQRDGIVYGVTARAITEAELLQVAGSLR